jgi:hypothetical protein
LASRSPHHLLGAEARRITSRLHNGKSATPEDAEGNAP